MNQDRIIGGGLPSLMGHQDVDQPGAFNFAQRSEPVVRMAGGGMTEDQEFVDDFALYDPTQFFAPAPPPVLPSATQAPAFMAAPVASPAPSPVVPFGSAVAAYSPAPSPYNQAPPAPTAQPTAKPAFTPFGIAQDELGDLGLPPAVSSAPATAHAAPAPSPTAQAPTAQAPAQAPAAPKGYSAFSGELSPELMKLTPTSGSDIYGKWQFDTASDRARADYEAQYGFNPESGQATSASYTGTPKMTYSENEYGPNGELISAGVPTGLDPRYGLEDTSGFVHGSTSRPLDKTHIEYTYSFFDPKTGKPVGKPITEVVEHKRSASDLLTDALFTIATGAFLGPMAGALGGGALGAGLAGAATGAAQSSVAGGDVLKGALTGGLGAGLGSLASGYINPLAAEASKAVGGNFLGDVVGGAVKGAATSGLGAAVGGKSISDAILSGALGGGASAGVSGAVGELGLPPELSKIVAPALTAAVLGKDPVTAALNAGIGQVISAAKTGDVGGMTGGEADERKGAAEVADLFKTSAPAPSPAPAPSVSLNDLEQMYAAAPSSAPAVEAPAPAPSSQTSDELLKSLGLDTGTEGTSTGVNQGASTADDLAKSLGLDTGTEGTSTGVNQGTSDDVIEQLRQAGIDTGTDGTSTGASQGTQSSEDLAKSLGLDTGTEGTSTGTDTGQSLADQLRGAGVDFDESQLGDLAGLDQDYTVSDTGKILNAGTNDLADQFLGGNLDQDFYVTDRGTIKSTTGEEGNFDENGNWVPYTGTTSTTGTTGTTGSGGTGGTGGTKTTTPTTTTGAQSGLDLNALLLALALGQSGQEAPKQELFNIEKRPKLQDIFKNYYA